MPDEPPGDAERMAQGRRLGPPEYARAAAAPDSDVQRRVLAGLRGYGRHDVFACAHVRRDPPDVETPQGTCVIRCRCRNGKDLCIKFYDDAPDAHEKHSLERLRRQVRMLRVVRGRAPVPRVVGVEEDGRRLGLPALVTTWTGEMLNRTIADIEGPARITLARDIASAAAAVNTLDAHRAGLRPVDLGSVNRDFVEMLESEAKWCEEWLAAKGDSADSCTRGLMEKGRDVFAARWAPLRTRRLVHLDLQEENITTASGCLSGFVDWDKATVASPQQELGKLICCLLSLPIARTDRSRMLREFLDCYHPLAGIDPAEVHEAALVFGLSQALYLLVYRRKREAAWASTVILNGLDAGPRGELA